MAKAEECFAVRAYSSALDPAVYLERQAFAERVISTLQTECLDYQYESMNATELSAVVDARLENYHFYRLHQSLEFLTPAEFSATLKAPIHPFPHSDSSD